MEFVGMKERPGGERQPACRRTGSKKRKCNFEIKKETEAEKQKSGREPRTPRIFDSIAAARHNDTNASSFFMIKALLR